MGINLEESCRRLDVNIKDLGLKASPSDAPFDLDCIDKNKWDDNFYKLIQRKHQFKAYALTTAFHERITSSKHYQGNPITLKHSSADIAKAFEALDQEISNLNKIYSNKFNAPNKDWESEYKKAKKH